MGCRGSSEDGGQEPLCLPYGERPHQEVFAEVLGVHRTYMGGVERGERNLTLKSMERMAERLEMGVLELMKPHK